MTAKVKAPTHADLKQEIAALKQQQQVILEQLSWMRMLLKTVGVDGPWVSPALAGMATGRSRDRVMQDIEIAELWRTQKGREWNLVYGTHYRNDQGMDATQATWKVHLLEYGEFTKIPPDQLMF